MSDEKLSVQAQIDDLVREAYSIIRQAEELANDNDLKFSFDISYGMGGTFYPASEVKDDDWLRDELYLDVESGGWVASSQTC